MASEKHYYPSMTPGRGNCPAVEHVTASIAESDLKLNMASNVYPWAKTPKDIMSAFKSDKSQQYIDLKDITDKALYAELARAMYAHRNTLSYFNPQDGTTYEPRSVLRKGSEPTILGIPASLTANNSVAVHIPYMRICHKLGDNAE